MGWERGGGCAGGKGVVLCLIGGLRGVEEIIYNGINDWLLHLKLDRPKRDRESSRQK